MSYNNSKISQGLSFQYEEKQKLKKSNFKNINDKTGNRKQKRLYRIF